MTYVIPYLLAARLVWGVIAPGAPSYAPGQTVGKHEDCARSRCVAPCVVARVIPREPGLQSLVVLSCRPMSISH